jgi:hypothetical protein
MRDKERQDAEQAILSMFSESHHGCKSVTIINDDMAIVTYTSLKKETLHIPVVKGKLSYTWFTTFEGAMLGAISILTTGDVYAAKYAGKVLDVNL